MEPIRLVVVGAGAWFQNYFLPAVETRMRGITLDTVVDLRDAAELQMPAGVSYVKRETYDAPLVPLLAPFLEQDGLKVAVLSHSNDRHVPDALELAAGDYGVLLEKPYALDIEQLQSIEHLVGSGKVGLLEYYLGKTLPLQILAGNVSAGPFNLGLMEGNLDEMISYAGELRDLVGTISEIEVHLLEGQGDTGSFLHRDRSLSLTSLGGGVLQDLGVHVFSMVASLGLGRIEVDKYQAAVSNIHREYFLQNGVPLEDIGETYAHIQGRAGGAEITAVLGKYVDGWDANDTSKGTNDRYFHITGEKGSVYIDLSTLTMTVQRNGEQPWIVTAKKSYVPVLYAALDTLGKQPSKRMLAALSGQRTVLDLQDRHNNASLPTYSAGTEAAQILR